MRSGGNAGQCVDAAGARTVATPRAEGLLWLYVGFVLLGVILPLVFSPRAAMPFFTVKLMVLGMGIGSVLLAATVRRPIALSEVLGAAVVSWGALACAMGVSLSIAVLGAYGQGTGWLFWAGELALWFAVRQLPITPIVRRQALQIILAGGLLVAVIALLGVIHWEPLRMNGGFRSDGRASGTLGNPLYLGLYLALAIVAGAELLLTTWEGRLSALHVGVTLALVVVGVAFLASLSRAAWVACCAGVMVWIFFALRCRRATYSLRRIGIVFVAAGLAVAVLGFSLQRLPENPVDVVGRLAPSRENQATATTRWLIWEAATNSIRQRPLVGWGPNNYRLAAAANNSPRRLELEPLVRDEDAHNLVLELGATWGIPGLALFVAWFASVGLELRRTASDGRRLGSATLAVFLVGSLAIPQNLVVTTIFMLLIGLAAASGRAVAPSTDSVGSITTPPTSAPRAGQRSWSRRIILLAATVSLVLGVFGGALYYLADTLERRGLALRTDAATSLRKAVSAMPLVDTYWFNLGRRLRLDGDLIGAREATEQGLRLVPGDANGLVELGTVQLEMSQWSHAVDAFRRASSSAPSRGDIHGYLAYALYQLGHERHADEEVALALRLPHPGPVGWYLAGVVLTRLDRAAEARSVFRDVLRTFPYYAPAAAALQDMESASG